MELFVQESNPLLKFERLFNVKNFGSNYKTNFDFDF